MTAPVPVHVPPPQVSPEVQAFPSLQGAVLLVWLQNALATSQASSVHGSLSLQSASFVHGWVMLRHQPPAMLPTSTPVSSTTNRFHVPVGLVPMKTERA